MGGGGGVRILGIDPGTLNVGFGCLELVERSVAGLARTARQPLALSAGNVARAVPGGTRMKVLDAGVLKLGGRSARIEARLFALSRGLAALLEKLRVDEVALEEAFCGKSVSAALRIGEARGVILAGARERGLPVHQFPPARVKRAVAGHGAASKEAVARMVCLQLALPLTPVPRDVTDALAVAYCRADERRDPRRVC